MPTMPRRHMEIVGINVDVVDYRRTIVWIIDCSGNNKRDYNYGL